MYHDLIVLFKYPTGRHNFVRDFMTFVSLFMQLVAFANSFHETLTDD